MNLIEDTSERLLPRIVLIACGSFSPPTFMHLRMFEIARDYFELQGMCNVIGGIISPTHDSYGKNGLALARHRCAMVKLAIKSSSWIRLSEWETQQDTWSRTKSVLNYHQNFMNNQIHIHNNNNHDNDINSNTIFDWLPSTLHQRKDPIQLKLLCGADLLQSFAVPGLWSDSDIKDIISNHGLVVITRSGTNPEKFIFESDLLSKLQKNITLITNWIPNDVSSTLIRRLLSRGQSVKYLLDDLVINYILEHGLYGSKNTVFQTVSDISTLTLLRLNQKYIKNIACQGEQNFLDGSKDEIDKKQSSEMTDHMIRKRKVCCIDQRNVTPKSDPPNKNVSTCMKEQQKQIQHNKDYIYASASLDQFVEQNDKITSKKIKMA